MIGPAWLLDTFAAAMIVIAAVSAGLSAVACARHRLLDAEIDGTYTLMGIAMAGMLAPGLSTLPSGVWTAVFAVTSAWFAWRIRGDLRVRGASALAHDHHVPHLIHSLAMVYMFLAIGAAMPAGPGPMASAMGGPPGSLERFPTLALILVLLLVGYAVWDIDRLADPTGPVRYGLVGPAAFGQRAVSAIGQQLAAGVAGVATASAGAWAGSAGAAGLVVGAGLGQPGRSVLVPRLASGCRIAMGITMAYMLIIML